MTTVRRVARPAAFAATAVTAASLLIGSTAYALTTQPTAAHTLATAITDQTGVPVQVRCTPRWQDLLAPMPGPARTSFTDPVTVEFSAALCDQLTNLPHSPATDWSWATIIAAGVLAHEIGHVTGIRDEAAAECSAITTITDVLVTLGVPTSTAVDAQRRYLTEVYPTRPENYRSDCSG